MVEYVGFDVSKEETTFCVKDTDGKVARQGSHRSAGVVRGAEGALPLSGADSDGNGDALPLVGSGVA